MGVDPSITLKFNYGKTQAYGSSTAPVTVSAPGSFTGMSSTLECGTTYHYQSTANGASGAVAVSADAAFTTAACPAVITTCTNACPNGFVLIGNTCH